MAIDFNSNYKKTYKKQNIEFNLSTILIFLFIISTIIALFFNKNVFAKSDIPVYEQNSNMLNIQGIISGNANISKFKEQVIGEYYIPYETTYLSNNNLPKDEQVVIQEGLLGRKKITSVITYENNQVIKEDILSEEIIKDSTPKYVYVGTSEFLSSNQVHLNDTLYILEDLNLKDGPNPLSKDIINISQYMDVVLLELANEEWAKVSYNGITGYIPTSKLNSSFINPELVDLNRIQKSLRTVNIDMELNKSSNLSLDDFKKMLTNLANDKNKIFENNYQVFYDIDRKYNINGVFLAALAIHESGYGTSQIANDKKNLFGFGAYDSNPYEYAVNFDTYTSGIEAVAKHLVKQYLNPAGTKIYDNEVAQGLYYNGPTVSGVNVRYATDSQWFAKVYKHMEELYNKLSN